MSEEAAHPAHNDSARASPSSALRSFGRRQGRKLGEVQQEWIDRILPPLRIDGDGAAIDPAGLFDPAIDEYWIEIGFGGGEHLAAQAAARPDIGFIGCEPYMNGVAKLLGEIVERRLGNIRLWTDDARLLLARLPVASLACAFILFPDPWPKTRHLKRRLVAPETIALLARAVREGGELRLASDHAGYVQAMLEVMQDQDDFRWTAHGPEDFLHPPADWVRTRYQEKTEAAGRPATFLNYRRCAFAANAHSSA